MADRSLARFPAQFEEVDHNPAIFADAARGRGLRRVHMTLSYSRHPEHGNETLSWSFRRVATNEAGWPGITSFRGNIGVLHYHFGTERRYRLVPALPGRSLDAPPGTAPNHQERVVAAFLRSNYDCFREASTRGWRPTVTTAILFDEAIIAKPTYWQLRWISRGRRGSPLAPLDPESWNTLFKNLEADGIFFPPRTGPSGIVRQVDLTEKPGHQERSRIDQPRT